MRIIIHYGNSYSKVSGLNDEQMQGLRKALSYKVSYAQAKYIPNPANRVKYCIDKRGEFATGLLSRVQRYLTKNNIEYSVDSTIALSRPYEKVSRITKPCPRTAPYKDQENALQRLLGVTRGTCVMPTGSGKSRVIAMLVEALPLKTLIIVPTLELKAQIARTLSEYFVKTDGIAVENIDSPALEKLIDFDVLILDEVHHSAAATYRRLNRSAWKNIRHRYNFTATPYRNNEDEQLLYEGIAGDVIFELTYQKAVSNGYIVPVESYYFDLPKIPYEGYTYQEVYKELVVNNEYRNKLIADTIINLYKENKYCLCLVKEVAHGKILEKLTGIPFATGADDDSRQWIKTFSEGRLKCLIATTGLMGEGIDSRPAEYIIIAGLGKAKSAFMQQVGRGVRKYPGKESAKIIIFRDSTNKWCLTSYRTHAKILETEYNTRPIRLEIE